MNDGKDSREEEQNRSYGGKDKANKAIPYILTAVLGGGTFSVGMPLVWPQLYRDDPFTGKQGDALTNQVRELRKDNEEMRRQIDMFTMLGPAQVRQNQAAIIESIKEIAELMREMQMAQLRHFSESHRKQKTD